MTFDVTAKRTVMLMANTNTLKLILYDVAKSNNHDHTILYKGYLNS